MPSRLTAVVATVLIAAGSLTCGESAGPDPNAVARVVITPDTSTIDTGDSLQLSAVARNAAGDELSGKSVAWSSLDAALASVTSSGRVRARWPGVARIVATSDQRSDTARFAIRPKITRLTVTPALDTLTSLFDAVAETVHAFIGNQPYAFGSYTWELSDPTVANVYPFGPDSVRAVQAVKNGTTFLRVREARGAQDSARIVVRQRVASFLAPQSNRAFRGCPVQLHAFPVDARNNTVPGAALAWMSTDTTLARVDSAGLVTPRVAGVDTIVISSQGVSRRVALVIAVAATPTFQASGAYAPVTAVGVGQYALGFGNLDPSFPYYLAPARFRVVSSDTTILKAFPADTEGYLTSSTLLAGPVRLVGRAVGSVTLTPYLCDAAGPSVSFPVTRAKLKLFSTLDSTARTDDPLVNLNVRTQDSTGAVQFIAVPLTVRNTATDTNVIRPESTYRHLPVGTYQTYMSFAFADSGRARIVLLDSSGIFLGDSSSVVHVRYPPLYIFSEGGGVPDTVHIGLRQKPFYDVYRPKVGLDRFVTGAPLGVHVSISDSTIVRVGPDSSEVPVGQAATVGGFDVAARDTRGTAIFTARAHRHADDQVVIVVGRPAVQIRAPSPDWALYPGQLGQVQVFAADSATGAAGFPTESVTVVLTVSDTAVISLDSATVTIPRGDYASTFGGITFKKPGTVTITATDPRVAPYSYSPATSTAFTISKPYLDAVSSVSLGVEQTWSFGVGVNGPLPQGQAIHFTNSNPAVATLADSVATYYLPGFASVAVVGVAAGVDTVIASTPGFVPDTGVILVGTGTVDVHQWPSFGLHVDQTWPLELHIVAPSGDDRLTAVTKTFTLTANGNIQFLKDGVPITTLTVDAGQEFVQFTVKGTAVGTGTVTVSAPNYDPVTKNVTVSP